MAILQVSPYITGTIGNVPNMVFINTNDTVATVTTAGYLTEAVQTHLLSVTSNDLALVVTTTGTIWYQILVTGVAGSRSYSLGAITNPSQIFAGNVQAGLSGTAGAFISYPGTASTGFLNLHATASGGAFNTVITNASLGQTTTFTIPDPGVAAASFLLTQNAGTQTIATGSLALSVGTLTLGSSGHASSLTLFPGTAANGTLIISPLNAGGAYNTMYMLGQEFPDIALTIAWI